MNVMVDVAPAKPHDGTTLASSTESTDADRG